MTRRLIFPPQDSSRSVPNQRTTVAKLVFTTQPGNTTAGSSISGPPTVTVQDTFGNTVTGSGASITIAIGTNPDGGTLSGPTTMNASSGVAAFSGLSINQFGNGYTLTASSAGLTGATSNTFNITGSGLGIISGMVTRVSNGTAVSGTLVEVFLGTVLVGTATTTGAGSYSIGGLADGIYTVRASSSGFVPQIQNGVTIVSAGTATVDLSLNIGIAIHAPVAGTVINDYSVLVTGQFDTSLGTEVGINVNGFVALQDGNEFATLVPVDATINSLVATVTNTSGTALGSHTIAVTVQPPTSEPVLLFRPSPAIALVSQPVGFTLTSINEISQIQLDGNGDGTIDFTGTTLEGVSVTFAEPGLYFPNVGVTDTNSVSYTATGIVQILHITQLDVLLQSKWNAMKNALRAGNTVNAASHIVLNKQAFYQNIFNNLTIPFATIDQYLPNLTFVDQWHNAVEYEITRTEGPDQVTYMVLFVLDDDGIWRIKFF